MLVKERDFDHGSSLSIEGRTINKMDRIDSSPRVFFLSAATHSQIDLEMGILVVGLVFSLLHVVIITIGRQQTYAAGERELVKNIGYYIVNALQILCVFTAGILALYRHLRMQAINHYFVLGWLLYSCSIIFMTIQGYTISDLLSYRLVSAYGFAPYAVSLVSLTMVRDNPEIVLTKAFKWIGIILTILISAKLITLTNLTRELAEASLWAYLQVYLVVAVWFLLKPYDKEDVKTLLLRWSPFVLYVLSAILCQTRSRIIWILLVIAAFIYLQKARGNLLRQDLIFVFLILFCISMFFIFTDSTMFFNAVTGLKERIYEDTRSGQFIDFFSIYNARDLVFGHGALTPWTYYPHLGRDRYGLDCGYLEILFRGGLPLLLGYFLVHAYPVLCLWRRYLITYSFVSVASVVVLLWFAKLTLSSSPTLSLDYYLVLLCIGLCLSKVS